eukprot:2886954-Prorocentrum_lima.AAC.1
MTSSLVGSEMCIRDSPRAPDCGNMELVIFMGSHFPAIAMQPVTVAAPVSYTHLTLPTICSV